MFFGFRRPAPARRVIIPSDYAPWLETLKGQITAARGRAALAVNAELIHLYHQASKPG